MVCAPKNVALIGRDVFRFRRWMTRSEQTGVVTKFKLRWTDSCTYELRQIWSNSKARRKSNKSVTRVVITAVYPNRYDYRCDCAEVAGSTPVTGTIVRVRYIR